MTTHQINSKQISYETVEKIFNEGSRLVLSKEAKANVLRGRKYLDTKLKNSKESIYGINTGFGALYDKSISGNDLEKLQRNLVMSHACGTGEEVPQHIVKRMLFLKIQGLSYGNSGIQLETIERLIEFYNHDILPVVYQQGSLGASGDLAPLAHLSLPLIGEGEVYFEGRKQKTKAVLKKLNLEPVHLQSKEGLALLNGTQFMSSYGLWAVTQAMHLASMADLIAAVSLDAFDGRIEPFDPSVHRIRAHQGQQEVAQNILRILKGSKLARRKKKHVQDPYSFRCIPQVHGASRDAIRYVAGVILTEINSVTDNPTLFPEEDKIISAGNFHGQPLALALDFLAIALSELGSISERRTYQLISGQRELPPFLVANPGLNSGFMIPQYTAASLVSQNKQLCTPASVDSIVSSNGQEDHVSMGANAATKLFKVTENLQTILAIELFNAAQALELRRKAADGGSRQSLTSSPLIENFVAAFRSEVSFVKEDRILFEDIQRSRNFIGG